MAAGMVVNAAVIIIGVQNVSGEEESMEQARAAEEKLKLKLRWHMASGFRRAVRSDGFGNAGGGGNGGPHAKTSD
ncbi:hypothetical protein CRG98_012517 [Punica granatum]|uniref:Uncharacterized protein n=1 Tax=Punica granatum TaxID=22663 RepID=A0A2I0KH05_PUNGR|nr:hypothetical protein CRG98_012517 [Punica granatum]